MSFDGDLYPTAGATSVMTTKGDIVDYDTQRQRLGIGSANQVLQVTAGGLPAWQTLSAGGATVTISEKSDWTNSQTTTSTSFTAVAGGSGITLTSAGSCLITYSVNTENDTDGSVIYTGVSDDGSAVGKYTAFASVPASAYNQHANNYSMANDGSVINMMWRVNANTGQFNNSGGSSGGSRMDILQVS